MGIRPAMQHGNPSADGNRASPILETKRAKRRCWAILACLVATAAVTSNGKAAIAAEVLPALIDDLSHSELILKLDEQPGKVHWLEHSIETTRARFGGQAERIVLDCQAGATAQIVYAMPKAPAIKEFHAKVWAMSGRPGVRVAARVVLPRSKNPHTGTPFEITVRGSRITQAGTWQAIDLSNLPELVAKQARVARVQYHEPVDERGAYVKQLLLIISGGTGPVEVLVDRVVIDGVLQPMDHAPAVLQASATSEMVVNQRARTDARAPRQGSAVDQTRSKLPLVPRIVQWQGESFNLLARLGFNTVAMNRMATSQELSEAARQRLFLYCPPPSPRELTAWGMNNQDWGLQGPYSRVLAWDLGKLAMEADIETSARWQELLERYDPAMNRRSVIVPETFVRDASRIADVLVLGRNFLGSNLSLREYATWLTQQKRQSRPGTLVWSRIETDVSPAHAAQLASQGPAAQLAAVGSTRQLFAQIALAATIKSQGFYFSSHTSLAAKDVATRCRALALELANLQLGLLEPWLASGKMIASARSNDPQITAAVLQVERSYLLVPIRWSAEVQPAETYEMKESHTFVVPGVPESSEVYFLSLSGADRLRHRRVTGGVRIFVDANVLNGLILITEDGHAFSQVATYLKRKGPRATKLQRDLAATRLQHAIRIVRSHPATEVDQAWPLLDSSASHIYQCDMLLARRDLKIAYRHAAGANSALDRLGETLSTPVAGRRLSIDATGPSSPESPELLQRQGMRSPTQGNGEQHWTADFENLDKLIQAGWRHQRMPTDEVTTAVRLSPVAPHRGNYCLELEATRNEKNIGHGNVPLMISTAPVWVTSAPVHVRAGEQVEISGMVRVPESILGTVDGLQIFDSLGGKSLALRFQQTPSWKPFHIVRTAHAETDLRVTFALAGVGSAQIDDVAIRRVSTTSLRQ